MGKLIMIDYKTKLIQLQGQKQRIEKQIEEKSKQLKYQLIDLENRKKAQEIIQIVAKVTQEQIKIQISDIVNLALQSISFEDKIKFDMDFVIRRNKTECDLFFIQDNEKINPIDGEGGGALDIASFGLIMALWSLKIGKKNNTIILDEPFKFLSNDLREDAANMVKNICDKLDIQLILVTHDQIFIDIADKIFSVTKNNGRSFVTDLTNKRG